MIYQPTNVTPSSFAGAGGDLVNAGAGMTVSWQVNGPSPMTAYQLDFYKNDPASTPLYSTGEVTLDEPFYGVDGDGNTVRFSASIPAATLAANGIVNGAAEGYKYTITQWWSENDSVAQTAENYFTCQAPPVVTITTGSLTGPETALEGTWSQAQGVGMDWVRWQIYIYENSTNPTGGGLVADSGRIHTQQLNWTRGGWVKGNTYYVLLTYALQNGYTGQTDTLVTASWTDSGMAVNAAPTVEKSPDCAGALVRYPLPTSGTRASGGTVTDGKLVLEEGEQALFTNTGVTPFTQTKGSFAACFVMTDDGFSMLRAAGSFVRAYANVLMDITITADGFFSGSLTSEGTDIPGTSFSYATDMTLTGKTVTLIMNNDPDSSDNGVWILDVYDSAAGNHNTFAFPSRYPAMTVSAEPGTESNLFILIGGMECLWAGILKNAADRDMVRSLTAGTPGQPDFTADWLYLTDFAAGDGIGTFSGATADMNLTGLALYRRESGGGIMRRIWDTGTLAATDLSGDDYGQIADYGVKSNVGYIYTIVYEYSYYAAGTHYTTVSADTGSFAPCWWNWILITGAADERGYYHAQAVYTFGLNLETGAMTNNNAPALLENFTRYPTRQGVSANYRTGSLTALIGNAAENAYTDTAAQAEAIMALSTDGLTKLLKSRKGEAWLVDTAGPVSLNVGDKYRQQPYTATLSWAETGDAEEASFISVPTDGAWQTPYQRTLRGLTIDSAPNKVNYIVGERLDLTGLSVLAEYSDGTSENVTLKIGTDPAAGTQLAIYNNSVTVTYTEDGLTVAAAFSVNVQRVGLTYQFTESALQLDMIQTQGGTGKPHNWDAEQGWLEVFEEEA